MIISLGKIDLKLINEVIIAKRDINIGKFPYSAVPSGEK